MNIGLQINDAKMLYPVVVNEFEVSSIKFGKKVDVLTTNIL